MFELWDSPRQREAYAWFTVELANLRAAFRWAADHGDLDTAAAIAHYAFLGTLVEQYEPIAWAEELIEPAKAVEHPRLAALYSRGLPLLLGRSDRHAIRYSEGGEQLIGDARFVMSRMATKRVSARRTSLVGQPERWAEITRRELEHDDDSHGQFGRRWSWP